MRSAIRPPGDAANGAGPRDPPETQLGFPRIEVLVGDAPEPAEKDGAEAHQVQVNDGDDHRANTVGRTAQQRELHQVEQGSRAERQGHHAHRAETRQDARESQTHQDSDQRRCSHDLGQIAGGKPRKEQPIAEGLARHLVGHHEAGPYCEDEPGCFRVAAIGHKKIVVDPGEKCIKRGAPRLQ